MDGIHYTSIQYLRLWGACVLSEPCGTHLCSRLWSTPRLLLRWGCFPCAFDRDCSGADLSVAAARSNGCRVEGQLDSDGLDVDGVFWSLRSMIELILIVCCCPCLVAAVAYVTKAHLRILDVLDDCKDALLVRANCSGIVRHARTNLLLWFPVHLWHRMLRIDLRWETRMRAGAVRADMTGAEAWEPPS